MELSASDAIRLLMACIAKKQQVPFSIQVPNKTTTKTMEDSAAGKGKCFDETRNLLKTWVSDVGASPFGPVHTRCETGTEAQGKEMARPAMYT